MKKFTVLVSQDRILGDSVYLETKSSNRSIVDEFFIEPLPTTAMNWYRPYSMRAMETRAAIFPCIL